MGHQMTALESNQRLNGVIEVWRKNRCISGRVVVIYCRWIKRFIAYCREKGVTPEEEVTHAGVLSFAKWYARSQELTVGCTLSAARSALHAWRDALETGGKSLPPWQSERTLLHDLSPLLREFADDMRQHRGSAESTIRLRILAAQRFVTFLRGRHRRVRDLRPADLDAYVIKCTKRYEPATIASICSMLRSFTLFLRASGHISNDLASCVLRPVLRKGARPRRTLQWSDVQRILRVIDRSTPCGKRDYALLLLMSMYGLGAGEIIGLTLDDVDWRAATLRIVRPKTRVEFTLPLLPAVARALVNYLRHGRPIHARTRHLFVRMMVPHRPLSSAAAVRHRLVEHARAAGVSAPYLGSHVLRHTHAARQMELGTSPKLIGDILGHRDPESTSTYLRVATEGLRRMALPVPR
jgi:integrase/recombinase XerD